MSTPLHGLALAALGSIAFSGKAIIVKLAYRYGVDAVTLIMYRMLFALPMFALIAWWAGRGKPPLSWRDRGIIVIDEYDDGSGWERVPSAFWTLRSTYWWPMVFPTATEIRVSHSYTPSVGATVGLSFFYDGRFQGDAYQDHKSRYCMDEGFEAAILKVSRGAPDGFPPLFETWISYILKTGGNWGGGTIGDFTLTIDKGDPKNLVSFCGSGVKKIGPTTFQMKATDFYPEKNLDVLILKRMDAN